MKKIVITGGHPSPALAVIDEIKDTRPEWEVYFIGIKHPLTDDRAVSYEYKEIQRRNIPFYNLITGKLNRLHRLPIGLIQSFLWLVKIRPDSVLTFGGYIGIPVAVAAFILRIPIFTHEQSLEMGAANRFISKLAVKVFLSWPQTKNLPPPKYGLVRFPADIPTSGQASKKIIITGLPLRKSITAVKKPNFVSQLESVNKALLYITGGSQGAHYINQLVQKKLDDLLAEFKIIHQVGESTKYNDLVKMRRLQKLDYIPLAHISSEDIGWVLQRAEMIVARAGMNTVSELLYLGKSAVLIPLLKNINKEQQLNAQLYAASGLGKVILQEQATPDKFLKTLLALNGDIKKDRLEVRRMEGQELQSPAASERILAEIDKIVHKNA